MPSQSIIAPNLKKNQKRMSFCLLAVYGSTFRNDRKVNIQGIHKMF